MALSKFYLAKQRDVTYKFDHTAPGVPPGPWEWEIHKSDRTQFVTLKSLRPSDECPQHDQTVIAMREDFAQFPYCGNTPRERFLTALPDLYDVAKQVLELLEISDVQYAISHDCGEHARLHRVINSERKAIARAEGRR